MAFVPDDIESAYLGRTATDPFTGGPAPIEVREIGRLHLPSGRIVACDPFTASDAAPFLRAVRPGVYAVRLAIADLDGDQRVAYAGLFFSEGRASNWEVAYLPHHEPGKDDYEYGYGVDSGTGSFGDQRAMSRLHAAFGSQPSYADEVAARMEDTYVHTWSWTEVSQFGEDGNVFLFSSGFGDGAYPSFFGLGDAGETVCLVTDFCVLGEGDEELDDPGDRRWWEFWKT